MTADFLNEEARMDEKRRFEERLERQGMAMYMSLVGAFGAMYEEELKATKRRIMQ